MFFQLSNTISCCIGNPKALALLRSDKRRKDFNALLPSDKRRKDFFLYTVTTEERHALIMVKATFQDFQI